MIFCHCAGVTDTTIAQVIEDGASSVEDIARCCGAGLNCAPCREELELLLAETLKAPCRAAGVSRACAAHESCAAPTGA